jgi:phosphoenolpyruvate carboxylase
MESLIYHILYPNAVCLQRLQRLQGANLSAHSRQRAILSVMSQPPSTITQNADVRFLGRLLGDIIRTYGGQALFERIEAIRAASVDRYRGVVQPRGLAAGLDTLSLDETVAFVRSFMLFSMLANLAEDRQGAVSEEGSTLASTLQLLSAQGVEAREVAA